VSLINYNCLFPGSCGQETELAYKLYSLCRRNRSQL